MGYFVKTVTEARHNRLKALPGQVFKDGTDVPTDLNIQGDRVIRNRHSVGTIFYTSALQIRDNGSTKPFMTCSSLVPMNEKDPECQPNADMIQEWEDYQEKNKNEDGGVSQEASLLEEPMEQTPNYGATILERIRTDREWARPTIETDGFMVTQERWETIMTFLYNKDNLLLTGPAGTGKTEVTLLACKRLGIQCHKYNMSTMSDPMSSLLGVHRIKDGKSVFEQAQFLEDIQKPGVILLDELNRAPLNALNYLMSCLDGTREIRNDYVSPAQIVKVHPECCFVATANIGAEYCGTSEIDPALDSRFFRVEMEYPEKDEEARVLAARHGIKMTDAMNIANMVSNIRSLAAKGELSTSLTVRQSLMAAKMVSCGFSVYEAVKRIFLPYFEGTIYEGEKGIVNKLIMQY